MEMYILLKTEFCYIFFISIKNFFLDNFFKIVTYVSVFLLNFILLRHKRFQTYKIRKKIIILCLYIQEIIAENNFLENNNLYVQMQLLYNIYELLSVKRKKALSGALNFTIYSLFMIISLFNILSLSTILSSIYILFAKQVRRKFSKEEFSNPDDTDDTPNKRCSSVSFYKFNALSLKIYV